MIRGPCDKSHRRGQLLLIEIDGDVWTVIEIEAAFKIKSVPSIQLLYFLKMCLQKSNNGQPSINP